MNGEDKKSYNCWVASKVGVPLYEACVKFKERDFEAAFGKLQPIR